MLEILKKPNELKTVSVEKRHVDFGIARRTLFTRIEKSKL